MLFPREASAGLGQVSTSFGHKHSLHGQQEHWFDPLLPTVGSGDQSTQGREVGPSRDVMLGLPEA